MSVELVTKDGVSFKVDENVAKKFVTIKNLIEECGTENSIPLPEIDQVVFNKILEFTKYHMEHPVQMEKEEGKDEEEYILSDWDKEFFKVDTPFLLNIVTSANYLDYKELLDLAIQSVALIIKDKSPEEIRTIFNIESDFTPEEEDAIRKENEWLEE